MPFPNFFGGGQYNMQVGNPAFSNGSDFSGTLNDILAPYQQMAQRFSSPYATMSPNSWLAQNHPTLAGHLDNAFLSMGMTPGAQGPEGAGGGISRAMQGLMGAQQFRRQQMIQSAMLPYQMGMQQVQMQDTLSQIKEREAMAPYYRARSDWYEGRLEEANRPKTVPGGYKVDDKGQTWQEIFDPTDKNRPTRLFNPNTGSYADKMPPEQFPTFKNQEKQMRQGGMTEIERMVDSEDQANVAAGKPPMDAQARNQRIVQISNQMYAGKVGAGQAVTEPVKDMDTFIKNERASAYASLPKPMNANDYQTAHIMDKAYWNAVNKGQNPYMDYLKGEQANKQQLDVDLAKYEKSSAPKKGISFQAYMQDRATYDGTPSALVTPSSNSGSNWTPK